MRKLVGAAFLAAIVLNVSGAAWAADIPMKAPVVAPVMAPSYNWTGWYIGAHAGYNWGRTRTVDVDGFNTTVLDTWDYRNKGFVGGGQIGYNLQSGAFVFGLEADLGYLDARGSGTAPASCAFFACDTVGSTRSDFYATVRGRIGVAWDRWMIYGTGGFIGVNTQVSVVDNCVVGTCGGATMNAVDSSFRPGWTAGGGVEVGVGGPWSLKAEYLYYDLGAKTLSAPAFFPPSPVPGAAFRWDTRTDGSIVRVGINYRFGADAIVARY